jgi:hypothetical protein
MKEQIVERSLVRMYMYSYIHICAPKFLFSRVFANMKINFYIFNTHKGSLEYKNGMEEWHNIGLALVAH